jgi:biopolymer transport protein ExbD
MSRLAAARATKPDIAVMIRGEQAVPHGRMSEIYEACRGAGVRHVAISVRTRSDTPRR